MCQINVHICISTNAHGTYIRTCTYCPRTGLSFFLFPCFLINVASHASNQYTHPHIHTYILTAHVVNAFNSKIWGVSLSARHPTTRINKHFRTSTHTFCPYTAHVYIRSRSNSDLLNYFHFHVSSAMRHPTPRISSPTHTSTHAYCLHIRAHIHCPYTYIQTTFLSCVLLNAPRLESIHPPKHQHTSIPPIHLYRIWFFS